MSAPQDNNLGRVTHVDVLKTAVHKLLEDPDAHTAVEVSTLGDAARIARPPRP